MMICKTGKDIEYDMTRQDDQDVAVEQMVQSYRFHTATHLTTLWLLLRQQGHYCGENEDPGD